MSFNLLMHCRWEANFSVERAGLSTWCRMTSTLAGGAIYRQPFSVFSSPPAHRAMQSTGRREGSLLHVGSEKRAQKEVGPHLWLLPFSRCSGQFGDVVQALCPRDLVMCMVDVFTVSLDCDSFQAPFLKGDIMILPRKVHLHGLMCVLLPYRPRITQSQVEF